jgi:alpha-glucosidase
VLGNHDNPRIASRIGSAQARVAAMMLFTLRGTPTLYYGDELGMHNVPIPPDRVQDPFEKNVPGIGVGRDPARTPMQWSTAAHAGFTSGQPWLPMAEDVADLNVEVESDNPTSMLSLHHQLIQLRRRELSLSMGSFAPLPAPGNVLAYRRQFEGARRFLIVLNLGSEAVVFHNAAGQRDTIVLSTLLDRTAELIGEEIRMRGDEGIIAELDDN